MILNLTSVFYNDQQRAGSISEGENCSLLWEDCKEQIDLAALASKEHILFYDEVCNLDINKKKLLSQLNSFILS